MTTPMTRLFIIPILALLLAGCQTSALDGSSAPMPAADSAPVNDGRSVLERDDPTFRKIWNDALPKLEKAIEIQSKRKDAPKFSFSPFADTKRSLKRDFNKILDQLTVVLSGQRLSLFQDQIATLKGTIRQRRKDISRFRELRAGAPTEHMLKTTRKGYEQKIAAAERNIEQLKGEIESVKKGFAAQLRAYGIGLSPEQTDVLLTRVDADDIVRMTVVYDSVKAITIKLMELTGGSDDDLAFAKRYYGMHVVLLELMVHMQSKYIDHVNQRYLPGLETLVGEARGTISDAQSAIRQENNRRNRAIYQSNIKANRLTIEAARLYKKQLKGQATRVDKTRRTVRKDLQVAKNTLQTVMVSAQLLDVLKTSRNAFSALMNLQIPELVPFENIQVRKKFEELSEKIAR
ncbi:MAG: hypothetical protein HQL53_00650 [Magnetococcales bacterium]|nr:hypothetical protein [Magnetococcales bacterium]